MQVPPAPDPQRPQPYTAKPGAITMREAALLQGFPRRYKFPTTDNKSAVALMIGNALPPPFIAAHGRSIKRVLQGTAGT